MLTLGQQLLLTARQCPDNLAIEFDEATLSYSDVAQMACRFSSLLMEQGITAGDRVLLCIDNSAEYVIALFGCWFAGAVVCPVSAQSKIREIYRVIDHADVRLIVTDANNRQIRSRLDELAVPVLMIPRGTSQAAVGALSWDSVGEQRPLKPVFSDASTNAMILYTSGTTGTAKGVLLTHENLTVNVHAIVEYLKPVASDRVLVVLPFHYSYGNSVLLSNMAVGATVVLGSSIAYPQQVVNDLRDKRITGFSGVPSSYSILLEKTDWEKNPGSLRYVTQAGGAMSVALTNRLVSTLGPKVQVFIMYGQTEATARLSFLPPDHLWRKIGSVGLPIPGVEIKIVDDHGKNMDLGRIGNVFARGGNIMAGYWRNPEATSATIVDDWLNTGDKGFLDEDGYLFLRGRSTEMIKTGAHRVSPEEIEEVACEVPGIYEAAAVGAVDELLGQVIHLYVAGERSAEQALARYCREQLSPHKIPQKIHWMKTLPRTSSGKLQRFKLKDTGDKDKV